MRAPLGLLLALGLAGCNTYRLEWGFKREERRTTTEVSESLQEFSGRWHTWHSLHRSLEKRVDRMATGDRLGLDGVSACLASLVGLAEHLEGDDADRAISRAKALYEALRAVPVLKAPSQTGRELDRAEKALRVVVRDHGLRV